MAHSSDRTWGSPLRKLPQWPFTTWHKHRSPRCAQKRRPKGAWMRLGHDQDRQPLPGPRGIWSALANGHRRRRPCPECIGACRTAHSAIPFYDAENAPITRISSCPRDVPNAQKRTSSLDWGAIVICGHPGHGKSSCIISPASKEIPVGSGDRAHNNQGDETVAVPREVKCPIRQLNATPETSVDSMHSSSAAGQRLPLGLSRRSTSSASGRGMRRLAVAAYGGTKNLGRHPE